MVITTVPAKRKKEFDRLALHPLQSFEWGEFRLKTGVDVIRLAGENDSKYTETAQLTLHPIPFTNYKIGYLPKGGIPGKEMLRSLMEEGKKQNCIFIKLEPDIVKDGQQKHFKETSFPIFPSPHPLFTKYTFILDLTKDEEKLMAGFSSKTRYNIKVAQKHGVVIREDDSDGAFENYLSLLEDTTRRQKFYAHDTKYHRLMWETLRPEGIAHLLTANYRDNGKDYTLAAWIVFLFNNILYYPYGTSSTMFRNVMASNLMMWEAIKFGKNHGATSFDMWGSLGPEPDFHDPWYGFHRFKLGYGPTLVEFIGSYDLVINPVLYKIYNGVHRLREAYLRIRS